MVEHRADMGADGVHGDLAAARADQLGRLVGAVGADGGDDIIDERLVGVVQLLKLSDRFLLFGVVGGRVLELGKAQGEGRLRLFRWFQELRPTGDDVAAHAGFDVDDVGEDGRQSFADFVSVGHPAVVVDQCADVVKANGGVREKRDDREAPDEEQEEGPRVQHGRGLSMVLRRRLGGPSRSVSEDILAYASG